MFQLLQHHVLAVVMWRSISTLFRLPTLMRHAAPLTMLRRIRTLVVKIHLLMEARDTIDIVKGTIDPWKDAHLHEPSLARGDWQH